MRIGLIAGGGALPDHVAAAAEESGELGLIIALDPFVAEGKFPKADRLSLGQFGKMVRRLKKAKCTHVCFAGIVKRPDFKRLKPDFKAIRHLPKVIQAAGRGDDELMRQVLSLFEDEGFGIISPQEVCADLMLTEGVIGSIALTEAHLSDALKACETAAAIGAMDIGQGAVVARGVVLAVEAQEGTDAMLTRLLNLPLELRGTADARIGVLAKLVKPTQDIRVDLPTLGPATVRHAAEAGLAGIVAEAGGAFVMEREETTRLADEAGLFIAGLPPKT
ncbi:LpxI family protein [Litorimonas sp. WD9-15]|uniref:LpxI family protein n=1 Tax=Litorimonas sp. WD9-15 TaxID=3418716 RepID=UPI003D026A39